MGGQVPFIYDKASSYTFNGPTNRGFNPRAATQASWTPPPPKPKRNGPLIDFNQHPDSYLIVPYGNLTVEPMHPQTKVRVKRGRRLQLFLRVCEFLGGLGLLFCIIAINKTSGSVGWIIRVGPAVALCHTFYAICHLCRDAASRSPASSASYMLFAGLLDTGLIPFFIFSAVMANADATSNAYGWGTLFNQNELSYKIIYVFYILNMVEAGLMAASLLLDGFLAVTFRRISKMPPDMNPLEDNLTARPNGKKHKRNKSEMTFQKHLSGSTIATERLSQINSYSPGTKRVPFVHTRTDSADRITLYGNEAAFNSRQSLRQEIDEIQKDPYRTSMASSHDTLVPSRPGSAVTPAANVRAPGAGLHHKPVRSSGLAQDNVPDNGSTWLSYNNSNGAPSIISDMANEQLDQQVRPMSPVSMMSDRDISQDRVQAERQNWFTGGSPTVHETEYDDTLQHVATHGSPSPPPLYSAQNTPKKRSRDPLGMNPPTPVHAHYGDENIEVMRPIDEPKYTPNQRPALYDANINTSRPSMGSRPASFVGSGGKSRFYGNLRTSVGGSQATLYHQDNYDDIDDTEDYRTRTLDSEGSANCQVYDSSEEQEATFQRNERRINELTRQADSIMLGQQSQNWNGTRKVSNSTGYDLKGGYAGLGAEFGLGMARRREVSGKVAEEGRSHLGYGGLGRTESKDGGIVTGQASRGGAAGWARFKGL